jgi:hypothetical protein
MARWQIRNWQSCIFGHFLNRKQCNLVLFHCLKVGKYYSPLPFAGAFWIEKSWYQHKGRGRGPQTCLSRANFPPILFCD